MNIGLIRQHKHLLLIGSLLFLMTNTALAGSFNRGVILHYYNNTFTWADADFDGIRNDIDPDDDNDGVPDKKDAFPYNRKESKDSDRDGIGDNADKDDDNDGVPDKKDAFPYNRKESVDTDRDGIGNNADKDDDNDGVPDKKDAFPLNAKESIDTDRDGIGNNMDPDDDNDGFLDYEDAFPLDPKKSKSLAYCGFNGVMTCEKIKGKMICRDRHFPDPRCRVPTRESAASKVLPLGTDFDRDGVRDDIRKKIEAKFGRNTPVTNYTVGMAKGFQKVLSGALSHKQINEQVTQINHLNECIQNKTNAKDGGLQYLLPEQLNTVARTRAYLKAAAAAYDKAGPPKVKPCGSSAKTRSHTDINGAVASSQGGGVARASSQTNSKQLKDYDVFFINGVMNDEFEAGETEVKLKKMLNQKTVALEYNKNHMLGQFFDLYVHKVGEIEIDKTGTLGFWQLVGAVALPVGNVRKALYDWLDPDRDIGHWAEKDLKRMIKTAKTVLNKNKKVIIVAHSEGNFFYRNIYKALNKWNSTKTQQCFAGIGFATPLSSKPGNYDYITSSNDRVINLVRNFWNSTLAANIAVPQGYGGSLLGHGMQEVYLSHPVSLRKLKTELDQVTNRLNKGCDTKKCAEYVARGGGKGEHQYTYPLSNNSIRQIEISFEAYNIPDRLKITANGKTIVDSGGLVSGFHQWKVDYNPKKHGTEFIAHVDAPRDGTKWKLCIDCEGSSCKNHIKRKSVSYKFWTGHRLIWECESYSINGRLVNQLGRINLSKGPHRFKAICECISDFALGCMDHWDNPKSTAVPRLTVSSSECDHYISRKEPCRPHLGEIVVEIK